MRSEVLKKLEVLAYQANTASTGAQCASASSSVLSLVPQHQKNTRGEERRSGAVSSGRRRSVGVDDAVVLRGGAPHGPHQLAGNTPKPSPPSFF